MARRAIRRMPGVRRQGRRTAERAASREPSSFDSVEPTDGQPPGGCCCTRAARVADERIVIAARASRTTERSGTSLSMIVASRGMCSQIWMPGTFVSIGWNSPRISAGASIFRSYMS